MGIAKRDEYEREFVQIVSDKEKRIYAQRGKHTDGVDVLLFIGSAQELWSRSVRCEIKTSIEPVRYFNPKLQAQYKNYIKTLHEYRVMTFYCFRTLSKKKRLEKKNRKGEVIDSIEFRDGHPEDKWRIFKIDEVPLNNRGKPYLDFFNSNGMILEKFLDLYKIFIDY